MHLYLQGALEGINLCDICKNPTNNSINYQLFKIKSIINALCVILHYFIYGYNGIYTSMVAILNHTFAGVSFQ